MSEETKIPAAIHDTIDAAVAAPIADLKLYEIQCDPHTKKYVWAKSPCAAIHAMVASWGLAATKVKDRDQLDAMQRVMATKK